MIDKHCLDPQISLAFECKWELKHDDNVFLALFMVLSSLMFILAANLSGKRQVTTVVKIARTIAHCLHFFEDWPKNSSSMIPKYAMTRKKKRHVEEESQSKGVKVHQFFVTKFRYNFIVSNDCSGSPSINITKELPIAQDWSTNMKLRIRPPYCTKCSNVTNELIYSICCPCDCMVKSCYYYDCYYTN